VPGIAGLGIEAVRHANTAWAMARPSAWPSRSDGTASAET
jgi:hypothetical protein